MTKRTKEIYEEGWYWHRISPKHRWGIVEVFQDSQFWMFGDRNSDSQYFLDWASEDEWVGPLAPP